MKSNFPLNLIICTFFLIESLLGFSADKLPSPFIILPQPQNVILLKGSGLELGKLQQVVLKGEFTRPVMGESLHKRSLENQMEKEAFR